MPVNASPQILTGDNPNYKVISNYQENDANTWYITSTRTSNFDVQILTPEGYNLVSGENTIGRTISITSGTSTYEITGTSNKVWTEGDGTAENPYIIKTTAQLQLLADTANVLDNEKYFKLDADIDWGRSIPNFQGTFDSNNHTVKATGSLFIANNGTIKNLIISNTSTNANFANVNESYGTVENCVNNSAISGTGYVGGIVNGNYGNITNCTNNGAVTDTSYVGDVVGNQSSGNLYKNYSGGSCNVGGVNSSDDSGAKKGYKLIFKTAEDYADKTKIESMLVGSGDDLSFELTKGYKITGLSSDDATFTLEDDSYKFTTTSTKGEIEVTATVDLDAVNLTAQNPTTEITSEDTKTIRVNDENKLNFVTADYSNVIIKANFEDSTYKGLQVTIGNLEIPADKKSSVSDLNVIDSGAEINSTDEVDNGTVSNFTLQGDSYSDIELRAALVQIQSALTAARTMIKF